MLAGDDLTLYGRDRPGERQSWRIRGQWFPDAFGGSMGEMLTALAEGRDPLTSGRGNLHSIGIAYAAVESSETGRAGGDGLGGDRRPGAHAVEAAATADHGRERLLAAVRPSTPIPHTAGAHAPAGTGGLFACPYNPGVTDAMIGPLVGNWLAVCVCAVACAANDASKASIWAAPCSTPARGVTLPEPICAIQLVSSP